MSMLSKTNLILLIMIKLRNSDLITPDFLQLPVKRKCCVTFTKEIC